MENSYNIELSEQPAQATLSMRIRTSVANLPQELGKGYEAIIEYLNELGEKPLNFVFAAYYNMDMEDLDVELGVPVSKPLAGNGEIYLSKIPAGKQVSCFHKGPYPQMEPAYNAILRWIDESSYTATGVSYEYYYNSPADVPESELMTKIVFPLNN